MPILLKKDAIRLLQASRDTLFLAVCGLGIPRNNSPNAAFSRCAEIGLIGAAAEMSMSACIIQCYGTEFMRENNGYFKSAQKILDDFRDMVENPTPSSNFLYAGIDKATAHRERLLAYLSKFSFLITVRASGLHGGLGVTRETAILKAREVSEFLISLGNSTRIGPYVDAVPTLEPEKAPVVVLYDELVSKINTTRDSQEKASLLGSLFLVLPHTPSQIPTWISSFQQISIAPKAKDIALLLDTLSLAQPAALKRLSSSGVAVPVKIDPNNPASLSIAPQMLRRSIEKPFEQWHTDASMASGRLNQKILHLPPIDFVHYLFAVGLEHDGIQSNEEPLPHVETWAFIAAALHAAGTVRPYWFLVRKTDDLSHLLAYLAKAAKLSNRINHNLNLSTEGFNALKKNSELGISSKTSIELTKMMAASDKAKRSVDQPTASLRATAPDDPFLLALDAREQEEISTGDLLIKLLADDFANTNKNYWIGKLCAMANETQDIQGLVAVLQKEEYKTCHTHARRALHLIDLLHFGPPCEIDWSQLQ